MPGDFTPPAPVVVHIGSEKHIRCPEPGCGHTVKKMWNYYSHARKHSDHRPYECECCDLTFKWQSSFKSHIASRAHNARMRARNAPSAALATPIPPAEIAPPPLLPPHHLLPPPQPGRDPLHLPLPDHLLAGRAPAPPHRSVLEELHRRAGETGYPG